MTKYSKEEKLAAIKAVAEGESIAEIARRYQISESVLKWAVRSHHEHGEQRLNSYVYGLPAEQKYEVLKYMHTNHLSCQEAGIQFGISGSSTVWQWERRYLENGIEGLENKKKGRKPRTAKPKPPKTREEELLERIEDLEIENEYLKKLNALVAEREKCESGNR